MLFGEYKLKLFFFTWRIRRLIKKYYWETIYKNKYVPNFKKLFKFASFSFQHFFIHFVVNYQNIFLYFTHTTVSVLYQLQFYNNIYYDFCSIHYFQNLFCLHSRFIFKFFACLHIFSILFNLFCVFGFYLFIRLWKCNKFFLLMLLLCAKIFSVKYNRKKKSVKNKQLSISFNVFVLWVFAVPWKKFFSYISECCLLMLLCEYKAKNKLDCLFRVNINKLFFLK